MPRFDLLCEKCYHAFEVSRSIQEEPPRALPCPKCGEVARRVWSRPTILIANPIEGKWNTKQYEHLAFDLWPETVQERHKKHVLKNSGEVSDYLRKRVQTKVHPREAKRGPVYFPQVR